MSRSFKKPYITDYSKSRAFYKRRANKKIRNLSVDDGIVDGNSYRRYCDSYDIRDWIIRYDPYPRMYYNWNIGEPYWAEPDPIYKYNRK